MAKHKLLESYQLGDLRLRNRLVMAPMTRSRAKEGHVPSDMAPEYYTQRASAGLIITEASQISLQGIGYINTPGIHTQEQVEGWKKVTASVHDKGGIIFLQLWHVGRVSHPDFHKGELPVAPSAILFEGQAFTPEGMKNVVTPRALETAEIKAIVQDYRRSAELAKEAGFDGVELHGANGYLPNQFLEQVSNQRTDEYGGSVENRARFLLEVTQALIDVWGKDRVGVRLSPTGTTNGMRPDDLEVYYYVAEELNKLGIIYLHLMNGPNSPVTTEIRKRFKNTIINNGGFTKESGEAELERGEVDLIAYGKLFLSNPDLPQRFEENAPLNEWDPTTFYGGTDKGYIDYPTLAEIEA